MVAPGRLLRTVLTVLLATGVTGCGQRPMASPPPELWFYQTINLKDDEAVDQTIPLWRRAVQAGYSRVILADEKFARLGDMNEEYFQHAARLRAVADSLGLDVIPGVFQIGRSSSMLAGTPDLVEALPVEGALFEVHGGHARVVSDPPVAFADKPTGHDPEARIDGHHVRMGRVWWRARWWYDLAVRPHRSYHLSVWIRTRGFAGKPLIQVLGGERVIHFIKSLGVERDQEWTQHHLVFNSLEHSAIRVYFGVWRRTRGEIEWRDWRIEESGPVNLVRRDTTPLVLTDATTGALLMEGRDYDRVADTLLGNDPWRGQYRSWHAPPVISVHRPDGARVRASWHQAGIVYDKQVTCCLSEPDVYAMLRDEAIRMRILWGPGRFMMMHDEIRAGGRDSACLKRGLSPGAILAQSTRECAAFLPGDSLYVWNDMFDPYQNAVPDFYLVGGDLAGSWEGLDRSIGIVNWNGGAARKSLDFFAGRGHRQVLAGYYDGRPEEIKGWIKAARSTAGVEAVMYTTWEDRYDDLEVFAETVRTGWH